MCAEKYFNLNFEVRKMIIYYLWHWTIGISVMFRPRRSSRLRRAWRICTQHIDVVRRGSLLDVHPVQDVLGLDVQLLLGLARREQGLAAALQKVGGKSLEIEEK